MAYQLQRWSLKDLYPGFNSPELESAFDQIEEQVTSFEGVRGKLRPEMPADDAAMFMQEYGIEELSLNRMIRLSFDLLTLQTFFTVGEDEVRAWTTRRGATAQESAGEIHTDLQRGFVRAEVVAYEDLVSLGSMAEAKAKGKFRLEGKEYLVKDGDIMHVRSSI